MLRTGKRSSTRDAALLAAAALLFLLPWARPCRALDVFTLWNQPAFPLNLEPGAWVEYRTQVMAGGRREEGLIRAACLGRDDGGNWIVELRPLEIAPVGGYRPVDGEGMRLVLDVDAVDRQGDLMEAVRSVTRWHAGVPEAVSADQLRDDPLVSASIEKPFVPDRTERREDATRIVQGTVLMCRQFVMTAADTQSVDLPAGTMIQVTTREVTAAVHDTIPFLGVAYAAERIRDESRLDPPSERFRPPPPRVRVEVMELVGFGGGAEATLAAGD